MIYWNYYGKENENIPFTNGRMAAEQRQVILFAIRTFLSIGIAIVGEYPAMYLVAAALFVLLIPYIRHYYFLENSVQKMYDLYEKL